MAVPLRKNNGTKPRQKPGVGKPNLTFEETNDKGDKRSVYGLRGSYAEKFGQITPSKGKDRDGNKLVSWDAIPECTESNCPIANKCPYLGKKKCTVMKAFVGSAASIIQNGYILDQSELLRVGTHLIPLYRNLCRLQIEEMGLRQITRINKAGSVVLNPIYAEIKSHILAIENLWKSLGLNDKEKKVKKKPQWPGSTEIPDTQPTVGDIVNGNPDYYDSLSEQ